MDGTMDGTRDEVRTTSYRCMWPDCSVSLNEKNSPSYLDGDTVDGDTVDDTMDDTMDATDQNPRSVVPGWRHHG